ncbi:DUF2066 domain-containing protein [Arboricoccus pini]|nr:DUF2066 domain-containing protein [Arboricoccus pini]
MACVAYALIPLPALAQQDDYSVQNIAMSADAADAVAARDQAIADAERRGLQILIGRLSNGGQPPSLDSVPIDRVVQSYEIASEQVGAKSYKGTLNVAYVPARVRDIMSRNNISVVHQTQPTLIVPAMSGDNGLALWFDADVWRGALGTAAASDPRLKLNLPLSDAEDLADLTPAQAQAKDADAFGKLRTRYQVSNVVLAILKTDASGAPTAVSLQNIMGGALRGDTDLQVPAGDDAMAAAANAVVSALRDAGKPAVAVAAGPTQSMSVLVPLVDLASWVQIKRGLGDVHEVKAVQVNSFSRSQAQITLTYAGDVGTLQSNLNGRGFELLSENGQWRLQRAGVANPGAL